MLAEFLSDPKTYLPILSKQVQRKVGIPNALTQELLNNDLDRFGLSLEPQRNRLPKTVVLIMIHTEREHIKPTATDVSVKNQKRRLFNSSDFYRTSYRIVMTRTTRNAVNWLCRQIRKGTFEFSRLRGGAFAKKDDKRPSVLPMGKFHLLEPSGKSEYRTTLRATFPDNLLLHALAIKLQEAFPPTIFLPGVCSYVAGKSGRDVVLQVTEQLAKGFRSVLRFDVTSFNETVCQERLLELCLARFSQLPDWSDADRVLFERLLRSYFQRVGIALKTPGVGIGMGSPLTSLFTNIYLDQLDRHLDDNGIPFVRYGDDVVAFFTSPSDAVQWGQRVRDFVATRLKQTIKEEKTFTVNLSPGDPGEEPPGFDFCTFHYSIGKDGVDVRIKDSTIEKVKRKIRFFTLIPVSLERHLLIWGGSFIDAALWPKIQFIDIRLGFPQRSELRKNEIEVKFKRQGWPASFLREARTESIRKQFQELDRYIRYRLERVEGKLGGKTGAESRFYARARRFGLRSFIDAWNRLPEPQKPE